MQFDVLRGQHSVGSHVRDAACYVRNITVQSIVTDRRQKNYAKLLFRIVYLYVCLSVGVYAINWCDTDVDVDVSDLMCALGISPLPFTTFHSSHTTPVCPVVCSFRSVGLLLERTPLV